MIKMMESRRTQMSSISWSFVICYILWVCVYVYHGKCKWAGLLEREGDGGRGEGGRGVKYIYIY